jgi:hypothetical protein
MILFGVLASVLLFTIGLAVEGGRVFTEYQRLQTAADMAALVGAQQLPCNTTDTSCISTARTTACDYAARNGGFSCTAGGSTGSYSAVPPLSCSPYSFINYGNASGSSCPASSPDSYSYIEVQLQNSLSIPIFNIPVTLSAHAVARRGQASARDFVLVALDPTMSGALTLGGKQSGGLVLVGHTMVDSSSASAILTNGSSTQTACDSEWYVTGSEPVPPSGAANNVTSNTGGGAVYAPPVCSGGSSDSPVQFHSKQQPIQDPYGASVPPTSATLSNCGPCQSTAYYYSWNYDNTLGCGKPSLRKNGHWSTVGTGGVNIGNQGCYELFPGVYQGPIKITGGQIYLNPGVYTLNGGFSQQGGQVCIFGAPACDSLISTVNSNTNCTTATFSNSQGLGSSYVVSSGDWYYYCSPWGYWDPAVSNLNPPAGSNLTTAPTFTDGSTPLNGVTFYLPDEGSSGNNVSINGNSTSYLAPPNPCPGTGSASGDPIPFQIEGTPSGSPTGVYSSYPSSGTVASPHYADTVNYSGVSLSSPAGEVYPSTDMRLAGETSNVCPSIFSSSPANVWSGEFGATSYGQHLHFLFWTRSSYNSINLNGGGTENWWGIIYDPGNYATGGGCANSCVVAMQGGAGGTGLGPPLLVGQVIADNINFNGSANFEIFYRSCKKNGNACQYGTGTSLVQ